MPQHRGNELARLPIGVPTLRRHTGLRFHTASVEVRPSTIGLFAAETV
jgi:hypothetical protein